MITSYVAVLAGNKEQFDWAVRNGDWRQHEKPVYVHDEESVRGYVFSRYEIVGTFYDDNKEPGKIIRRVRERII